MYIDLPEYCFAYNGKAGISSFARAIIAKYFPEHEPQVKRLLEENIENHHRHLYFLMVKKIITANKPVVLLVRNPVDRFLSAMNQIHFEDIDAALNALEDKTTLKIPVNSKPLYLYQDVHFRKQISYLSHENILFRFPDHILEAAEFLELGNIMKLNSSRKPKLKLSEVQLARVKAFYEKDSQLFESIKKPKTIIISRIKHEWNEIFQKYFVHDTEAQSAGKVITWNGSLFKWNINEEALLKTKQFLSVYPYSKSIIVHDVLNHFLQKFQEFTNSKITLKELNEILV